jgi:K(+)-stimulated pyrophosphate-energized sodium pump
VTPTVLVLSIYAGGLLFALALGAWLSTRAPSTPDVRRLAAAVERAGLGFSWSQYRLVALLTGVALVVTLVGTAWWSPASTAFSRGEAAFWFGLTLLLGAASSCAAIHFASRVTSRAAAGVAAASEGGTGPALLLAARAGGGAAIAADALCSFGFLGSLLLIVVVKGGHLAELAADLVRLSSGYALGGGLAAAVLHRGASVLRGAASLGAAHPELESGDSRNPAAVSRLLGEGAARTVSHCADFFLAASLGHVATALAAVRLLAPGETFVALLPWALLPFVLRAFGLLATCFGTLVVRTTEREVVQMALFRGSVTTFITLLGGALAASLWLLGGGGAKHTAVVVISVVTTSLVATSFFRGIITRKSATLRDGSPTARAVRGVAAALEALPVPAALLALAFLLGAVLIPRTTALGGQAALWFAVLAVSSLFALAPQCLAFQLSAAAASSARGMLELCEADAHRLATADRLISGHETAVSAAHAGVTIAGAAAALFAALGLVRVPLQGSAATVAPEGALWASCAPLAVSVVFAFVGSGLWSVSRAASGTAAEVERQLAEFVGEDGSLALPSDFAPSYRACIDTLQQDLRRNLLVPLIFVIGWPLSVAITLRLAFDASAARAGLCVAGMVASTIGLVAAWVAEAGADTLEGHARAANHTKLEVKTFGGRAAHSTFPGLTISGACTLLRSCGPMAQVLAKASVATSLVIACFLL